MRVNLGKQTPRPAGIHPHPNPLPVLIVRHI